MDWELVMVFAMCAVLGSFLTFGIVYDVIDTFFVIENDEENTDESKD